MRARADMLFLVYSPLSSSNIRDNLGLADYSYYFVMERFLPLLRQFAEVEILEQPPCDEDVARRLQSGPCVYFSFTPPNKVADISRCPVVPVFAWEYSTLPDEAFSSQRDNWVRALRQCGNAITHSRYALEVVRDRMGEDFPIESIPAPIWDSYAPIRDARRKTPPRGLEGLNLDCTIIDSHDYLISNTSIRPRQGISDSPRRLLSEQWDGEPLAYEFANGAHDVTLIGFNDCEPWGVWSRSGYPWVLFDHALHGEIEFTIEIRGYMQNIGKRLRLEMGSASADLLLSEKLQTHVFRLHIEQATNVLAFVGVVDRAVGAADPRDIGMGISRIGIRRPDCAAVEFDDMVINMSDAGIVCTGLHDAEGQGRWTSSPDIAVTLPTPVAGDLKVVIEVFHILHNHQREVQVCVGERRHTLTLEDGRDSYEFDLDAVTTTDYFCIIGLGCGPGEKSEDPRMLGLGIARISLSRREPEDTGSPSPGFLETLRDWGTAFRPLKSLRTPRGILYTAIFNPKDGRKNWEDIITGFVYAFREDASATLLIKITYHELAELYEDIFTYLMELHPFQCRLLFIHGFLSGEQYEQLLLHSHFIVNASRGEGQCLPLMEFMSAGVPAIAPRNTAMGEYIDSSNAFIVDGSPELTFWPQDPRQVFRTLWHRIDWESLVTAFRDSAKCARGSRRKYRRMSLAASRAQQRYCSMELARSRFEKFLGELVRGAGE